MARDESKADENSSESGWLFLAALFAGLSTEIFTAASVLGGVAVMLGYLAMGIQASSWWEKICRGTLPLSVGKREMATALWPAALGGLATLWLVPRIRRRD